MATPASGDGGGGGTKTVVVVVRAVVVSLAVGAAVVVVVGRTVVVVVAFAVVVGRAVVSVVVGRAVLGGVVGAAVVVVVGRRVVVVVPAVVGAAVPRAGVLEAVTGQDAARAVPGIEDLRLTIPLGSPVEPLPEGSRYLGFVFARAAEPAQVESALREAPRRLEIRIAAPRAETPAPAVVESQ